MLTQFVLGIGDSTNEIPPGVVYTCELELIDASRLPSGLQNRRVFAADVYGALHPTIGVDGIARPGP